MDDYYFPEEEVDQDAIGYCIKCLSPKPSASSPDLCQCCLHDIERYLKETGPKK